MVRLQLGQIVYADFVDPQGNNAGEHPAMIITPTADIENGEPVRVVVISTKLHHAKKDEMIEMRWQKGGHPVTKLTERCAAICVWVREVKQESIRRYGGKVYGSDLQKIIRRVADLKLE